jgi:transcriptional regulator with XRE-family HTH domain
MTLHFCDNEAVANAPLSQVVGFRLRELREMVGMTQDHVARAAQRLGFEWSRSSVAALEAGDRDLSAAEFLALPYILDEAARVSLPTAEVAFGASLAELLSPRRQERLALSDNLSLAPKQVSEWLGETTPKLTPRRLNDEQTIGEAEHKAARRLGIDVARLHGLALDVWGRSLTAERDARLANRDDVQPQTRGHVTRELLDELRKAM